MSFPSYDSQSVNKQAVVKEIVSTNFPQDPLVSELQKAVNAARKAEARVRKVETDRTNRQEQWNQWELALKKSYTKEKQCRRTALEKLGRGYPEPERPLEKGTKSSKRGSSFLEKDTEPEQAPAEDGRWRNPANAEKEGRTTSDAGSPRPRL